MTPTALRYCFLRPFLWSCGLLVLAITGAVRLAAEPTADTTDLEMFVAPNGNDANPGTLQQPFASLAHARDVVRQLPPAAKARKIRVLVRGGTYHLDQTLTFTRQDGAPAGHTITYAAYQNEIPVLSAGVPITGWTKLANPPDSLPTAAHGKVWSAPVPASLPRFHTLYDGSTRLPCARSQGFKLIGTAESWHAADQQTLRMPPGVLTNGPNLLECELLLIPAAPWTMNILPLESFDPQTGVAHAAIPGTYALTQPRFGHFPESAWIENSFSGLDQPGEWVLDYANHRLYLWPTGPTPGDQIEAPALTEMIRLEGEIDYEGPTDKPLRGVTIQGLTFTHADRFTWEKNRQGWGLQHDWEMFDRPTAMLRLRGTEDCAVQQCHFVNAGATAIRLDLHARNNRIDGNHIEHVGGAGILLAGYGPGTKNVNRLNQVTRNHIHHVGEIYWHSSAIFVWQSGDNQIANNLIHHTPYSGIVVSGRINMDRRGLAECSRTVRWNEVDRVLKPDGSDQHPWQAREPLLHSRNNLLARNEIHHTVEVMTDGNGIYISGAGGGNTVRENFVHDCPSPNFAEGIRCDDDQYDTVIDRNILWRLGGMATYICIKGRNHVTNNILACPLTPPGRGMLSLEPPKNDSIAGSIIQRNLIYATRKGDRICFQGMNYYGREAFLADCKADSNLYFNTADPAWGNPHLAAERSRHSEPNSIIDDPLFVDAPNGDFHLKPNSPVSRIGFVPIDQSQIGLNAAGPAHP